MGKVNRCLKRSFISLNTMSAIDGCLMIYKAIQFSADSDQLSDASSPVWGWLLAIGVLGISCLGIYAGYSEKEILLKIFAGFMAVGMIIMLIFGILLVVETNKGASGPDRIYAQASEEVIAMAIFFGYAASALLGLVLSLLMIRQVRRSDSLGGTSIAMRGY